LRASVNLFFYWVRLNYVLLAQIYVSNLFAKRGRKLKKNKGALGIAKI